MWRDLHHHWSGHLQYPRVSEEHFSKHPPTIHSHGNSSCVLATWGWPSVDGSSPKSNIQKGNKLAYIFSHFMDLYPMTFNCSIMCSTGSASFFLHEEVYAATMLISLSSSVRIHSEIIFKKLIIWKVTIYKSLNIPGTSGTVGSRFWTNWVSSEGKETLFSNILRFCLMPSKGRSEDSSRLWERSSSFGVSFSVWHAPVKRNLLLHSSISSAILEWVARIMTHTCQEELDKLRNVFDAERRHMLAISLYSNKSSYERSPDNISIQLKRVRIDFPDQNLELKILLNGRGNNMYRELTQWPRARRQAKGVYVA